MKTTINNAKEKLYDDDAKILLSYKIFLAWILKNCVEEFANIDVNVIANKCIEGEPIISKVSVMPDETNVSARITAVGVEDITQTEGKIIFDIRFNAVVPNNKNKIGLIINVEAQNDFSPGYPLTKRGIYYCSRMISAQNYEEYQESLYKNLKKVYSIWICSNPSNKWKGTITKYSMTEQNCVGNAHTDKSNYDLLTVVLVCLGKNKTNETTEFLDLFNMLFKDRIKAEEKIKILESRFNITVSKDMERSIGSMCNLSKGLIEEGIEEGIKEGIKMVAIKMLKVNQPDEIIMQFTELTLEELEKLKEEQKFNDNSN